MLIYGKYIKLEPFIYVNICVSYVQHIWHMHVCIYVVHESTYMKDICYLYFSIYDTYIRSYKPNVSYMYVPYMQHTCDI